MELNKELYHRFQKDGYAFVSSVFSEEDLAEITLLYDDILEKFIASAQCKGVYNEELIWVYKPEQFNKSLLQEKYIEKISQLSKYLIGTNKQEVDISCRFFCKPGNTLTGTPWHQDEAYCNPKYTHQSLNIWVPLHDVGIKQGCLKYIPGSHTKEVLEHEVVPNSIGGLALRAIDVDSKNSISAELKVTEVAAHHCRMLHGSHINSSNQARKSLVFVCKFPPTKKISYELKPWHKSIQQYWQ